MLCRRDAYALCDPQSKGYAPLNFASCLFFYSPNLALILNFCFITKVLLWVWRGIIVPDLLLLILQLNKFYFPINISWYWRLPKLHERMFLPTSHLVHYNFHFLLFAFRDTSRKWAVYFEWNGLFCLDLYQVNKDVF